MFENIKEENPRPRKYTDEDIHQILKLLETGHNISDVAKHLNMTKGNLTVLLASRKNTIHRKSGRGSKEHNEDFAHKINKLINAGLTQEEVGKIYNLSRISIIAILKRHLKKENPMKLEKQLLLDENRGIYIPKKFAENFETKAWNVSAADVKILKAGPDHKDYWETWDDVLKNAHFTDENKVKWTLEQDGDLWAIPEGYSDEEEEEEEETQPEIRAEVTKEENPKPFEQDSEEAKSLVTIDAANAKLTSFMHDIHLSMIETFELISFIRGSKSYKLKPRYLSRLNKKQSLIEKAYDLVEKARILDEKDQ